MTNSAALRAEALRRQFKTLPAELRNAHQAWSIRIWRALSWLERSERADADDLEGHFLPLWIAFNALYGRMDEQGGIAGDHAGWQAFLASVSAADCTDRLGRALWDEQLDVLRMIESPYLFKPFWLDEASDIEGRLQAARRRALVSFQERNSLGLLQELFERIYVLRQQIFHGAATCGSSVNRHTLKMGARTLAAVVPVMIEIMIDAGVEHDWGQICYPPVDPGERPARSPT